VPQLVGEILRQHEDEDAEVGDFEQHTPAVNVPDQVEREVHDQHAALVGDLILEKARAKDSLAG
jgi:hypothetical protein